MHRLYVKEDITVFWDSDRCRHAKRCVTGCPKVFDFARRPWIDLSQDEMARIWQTIEKCPTGALSITYNHGIRVAYLEKEQRSVAYDGEREIGECRYQVTDEGWNIYHTEVDPAYGGKQIAKRLVFAVLEQAERKKAAVIPSCSYAARLLGS